MKTEDTQSSAAETQAAVATKTLHHSNIFRSLTDRRHTGGSRGRSAEARDAGQINCRRNRRRSLNEDSAKAAGSTNEGGTSIVHNSLIPFNAEHSFGLSKSLSTDSLRNACGFYDDENSDKELKEVQDVPVNFRTQKPLKESGIDSFFKRRKSSQEQLLGNGSYSEPVRSSVYNDTQDELQDEEAICALDALDAVLSIHEASQLNATNEADIKIEDCLLDLDSYLAQMDDSIVSNDSEGSDIAVQKRVRTEGRNRSLQRNFTTRAEVDPGGAICHTLERGSGLRKTINIVSSSTRQAAKTQPTKVELSRSWRRNSMRRTAPLTFPVDNFQQESNLSLMPSSSSPKSQTEFKCVELACEAPTTTSPTPSTDDFRRSNSQSHFPLDNLCCNSNGILTQDNILHNLIVQSSADATFANRPRQLGRRVEGYPQVMSFSLDVPNRGCCSSSYANFNCDQRRPLSAPASAVSARLHVTEAGIAQAASQAALYIGSETSSVRSSHNNSPISIISSSDSVSTLASTNAQLDANLATTDSLQPHLAPFDPDITQMRPQTGNNNKWPHSYSRTLALICCSLGLFNICRFAVLTINYGGNFVLQFFLLSILFGIPLFWLQMCLGAKIKAGPISMWKISPICKGIGIALLTVHCFMAIYSIVAIGWILIYLRDAFPSNGSSLYRWQYDTSASAGPNKLAEGVANYFNLIVLQRLQFAREQDGAGGGDVRFRVNDRQLAFNLAILWAAVFLILCKGLRSYGKMVFVLGLLPLITLVCVTCKILYVVNPTKLQNIFTATDLDDFLINSKTWTAAAQETFLTWGLLGASVIAVTSRSATQANSKTALRRDAILSVLITLFGLAVAALLGLCCLQVLSAHSCVYVPGSYERPGSYVAVYFLKDLPNANILSYPPKWVPHYSSFVGEVYRRPGVISSHDRESGYQALRFISEIFPVVAVLTSDVISWIWIVVAFACFALFGLAQLCVMWKPISSALGNSTSSVLLSCVTGLLLTIPFATEVGISILHYMDIVLGGAWFIPLLWTAQIFGVFLIRGRPYNGDDLVNDLRMSGSMSAFLALSWNVLLPIGLITLAIIDYKTSQSNQFFYWRGKSYFSYWARKVAGLTQIGFLLLVPVVALIQIYRYLAKGPSDILERIQLLYRPSGASSDQRRGGASNARNGAATNGILQEEAAATGNTHAAQEDAPPKYTPPPSYTTATGARLAKIFRQSIRRSVRRILGETGRARSILPTDTESNQPNSLPPDYTTVLSHPSGNIENCVQLSGESIEIGERPRPVGNACNWHSLSPRRKTSSQKQCFGDSSQRHSSARTLQTASPLTQRPYTAEDVVTVLRSSMRVRQERHAPVASFNADEMNSCSHRSVENLILNAEPVDHSPAIGADSTEQDDIVSDE